MIFFSHGFKYSVDQFGVIHQICPEPYTYNEQYTATYDTESYKAQSDLLQALRLGFTIAAHGTRPTSILDYGYGNGAFMKFARQQIDKVTGLDVTGRKIEGCEITETLRPVDVITFWDCLEHIEDMSFVRFLPCHTVVVSLPYCHYFTEGQAWFDNEYKHRKPNEHLHHFDQQSLATFMAVNGWHRTATSTHEDIVRKSTHGKPNILSMAFKRA
jgi:hypothetical protein